MARPSPWHSERLARWLLSVVLIAGLAAVALSGRAAAQDGATPAAQAGDTTLVDVALDPMPLAPSFLRLIRITMEPGSSIPMRSHPGPKIDRVESGSLTAVIRDEGNTASISDNGGAQAAVPAGQDQSLDAGDVLVIPLDTFYALRNDGPDPVVLLSSIMLPAGHQRPPGITYADGEPPADAYNGITNQILGDGVATSIPASPGRYVVRDVTVTPDAPLAASGDLTLLSVRGNGLGVTIDSGRVQVTRTVSPGPQRDADAGATYTLITGDGMFFPDGHAEVTVPEGQVAFYAVSLAGGERQDSGASTAQDGTPAATGPGAITITNVPLADSGPPVVVTAEASRPSRTSGGSATEEPSAASSEAGEPTETPTDPTAPEPSEAATDEPTEPATTGGGDLPIGTTVATNDVAVNLRAQPSASAELVATIDAAGGLFVVIGEPVTADGFTWVPVQSLDDPSLSGWVVIDFVDAV